MKTKRKKKSGRRGDIDPMTKDILDRLVRIKARERMKGPDGVVREFRSTVLEEEEGGRT